MGKVKRKSFQGKKTEVDENIVTSRPSSGPQGNEFFQDEIDDFHEDREKILLKAGASMEPAAFSSEDEVLGLDSDDDDEEYEVMAKRLRQLRNQGFKEDLASDVEDDSDEAESDGGDNTKWGKMKKKFYGGHDEAKAESDEEMDADRLEEEEAMAIQRRMAQQLDDDDLGLELLQKTTKTIEKGEKIEADLTKLSKKERLQLVQKRSPELLELINDFKIKLSLLRDRWLPLRELVTAGDLPPSSATHFICAQTTLYLNYCLNVNFYLLLKARLAPVEKHPVIKRIVQYRKLIQQLQPVEESLAAEVDAILQQVSCGESLAIPGLDGATQQSRSRRRRQVPENDEDDGMDAEDEGEGDEVKDGKKEEEPDAWKDDDCEDGDGRRAINYKIEKNKGLTARKKKELRNPRVKHRMKFQKAQKRRRSQVKEVHGEKQRYGGESSGIRAGLKRSIRLK